MSGVFCKVAVAVNLLVKYDLFEDTFSIVIANKSLKAGGVKSED